MTQPILSVRDLKVHFPLRGKGLFSSSIPLKAVDGVSFDLFPRETLGIVGESGCGKSTLGRAILHLLPPTSGKVVWLGEDLTLLPSEALRRKRQEMQIVFQDPLASLDPRMTIGDIIAEPLRTFQPHLTKSQIQDRVMEILPQVGLNPFMRNRYPHEFSGGQCQRIGIARAMILKPKLIICDEPVSALDVSIRAQIVNLLQDLQEKFGISLIFISHDLSIVRHICHRIMVLYLGRVMEIAPAAEIYNHPRHPYTKALISAVPIPDPRKERKKQRTLLKGDLPSPVAPPSGCVFRTRCPQADARCAAEVPILETAENERHLVACHYWRTT